MNRLQNPTNRQARLPAALLLLCASAAQAQTVQITSPADGAVVYSGQTFVVTVHASPGAFKSVAVIGEDPIEDPGLVYAPPYQFAMRVPPTTASRTYHLGALGTTTAGESAETHIAIRVERPDPPVRIRNELSKLFDNDGGHTWHLQVSGKFADGSEVTLTYSSLTSYSSDNPAVATVDRDGVVQSVGPGSAMITIRNNGAVAVVPVYVAERRSR